MKPANRFTKGHSVYTCRLCTRRTRQTGRGDNEMIDLCAECFDLGGLENMITDGHALSDHDVDVVHRLRAIIASKGGNPDRAFDLSLLQGVDHV